MTSRRHVGSRTIVGLVCLIAMGFGSPGAFAQNFPSKPVEMSIPWPPGGRTDIMVRLLAPYLEKELGQPVPVVNRVGGGGVTGMVAFKNARPDGYTISSGGISLSSMQYQKKIGVGLWDFNWYARAYSTPMVLAVPGTSPFKTAKDFVDFAKANPGKLKHGSTGVGSSTHLASEAMANKLGIKIAQVPYRGEGPAAIALAGGEADFSLGLMVAFRTFTEDGKMRILGVASDERDENVRDIPTMKEQGYDFTYQAFEAPARAERRARAGGGEALGGGEECADQSGAEEEVRRYRPDHCVSGRPDLHQVVQGMGRTGADADERAWPLRPRLMFAAGRLAFGGPWRQMAAADFAAAARPPG